MRHSGAAFPSTVAEASSKHGRAGRRVRAARSRRGCCRGAACEPAPGLRHGGGTGRALGLGPFLGLICSGTTLTAFLVLRVRGFRVESGVTTLVMRRRTASGKRIRHVPLRDIVWAERITQPGAHPGILVTLRDDTNFPVFDGDLPGDGRRFLDRLVAAVGQRGTQKTVSEIGGRG